MEAFTVIFVTVPSREVTEMVVDVTAVTSPPAFGVRTVMDVTV